MAWTHLIQSLLAFLVAILEEGTIRETVAVFPTVSSATGFCSVTGHNDAII